MENNQNNRSSNQQPQAKTNTTPTNQSSAGSSNQPSGSSQNRSTNSSVSGSSSSSPSSSSSSNSYQSSQSNRPSSSSNYAQGRTNQQATTGQGGMKNIQDKLQQFGSTAAEKVNSLTTTQKVIGGSLLALGAGWLALGSKNKAGIKNKVSSITSKKTDTNKGTSGSSKFGSR